MASDKTYTAKIEITDSEGVTYSVPLADLSDEVRNEIRSIAKTSLDNILQDSLGANIEGAEIDEDFDKSSATIPISTYSHSTVMPYHLNNLEESLRLELRDELVLSTLYFNRFSSKSIGPPLNFSDLEIGYLLEFVDVEGEFITKRKGKIYDSLREKNYEIGTPERGILARKFDGSLIKIKPTEGNVKRAGHLVTLTSKGKQVVSELVVGMDVFRDRMDKRLYVLDILSRQNVSVTTEKRKEDLIETGQFSEEVVEEVLEDLKINKYIRGNGITPINKAKRFLENFRERIDYLNKSGEVVEEMAEPETNLLVAKLRDRTYSGDDLNELEKLLEVKGISDEISTAIRVITEYDGIPEEDKKTLASIYDAKVAILDEYYLKVKKKPVAEKVTPSEEAPISTEEIRAIVEELIDLDAVSEMNAKQKSEYYKQEIYSDARLVGIPKKRVGAIVAHVANPDSWNRD